LNMHSKLRNRIFQQWNNGTYSMAPENWWQFLAGQVVLSEPIRD
jgi:hypothetical protein